MGTRKRAVAGPILMGVIMMVTAFFVSAAPANPDKARPIDGSDDKPNGRQQTARYVITPVFGPSWLKLLGIFDIRLSAMGEMGGDGPPQPSPRIEPDFPIETDPPEGGMGMGGMMGRNYQPPRYSRSDIENMLGETFFLAGIDFYRIDCQSCHGPNGDGAPPEINSLIGPFQGTSPGLIEERMKKMGRPIGDAMAKELASQAEQNILQRLKNGGKKMPPFRHLEGKEVAALIHYLKKHVGAPEAQGEEMLVVQPTPRVGEHLVKGTCQICHDATGPGMRGMGMMQGNIPSLASFPWEQSMQSVVWQVNLGTHSMMMGGQRMPAYPYITAEEAASAYLYLVGYPPY